MHIRWLGWGNAWTIPHKHNTFHSMFVLSEFVHTPPNEVPRAKHFLVDAGHQLLAALDKASISPADIEGVFHSHEHSDHFGGMEDLAFWRRFHPDSPPEKLVIPCTADMWPKYRDILGAIRYTNGAYCTVRDYFEVRELTWYQLPGGAPKLVPFKWRDVIMTPCQNVHVPLSAKASPPRCSRQINGISYGLFIEAPSGTRVYFSGDVRYREPGYPHSDHALRHMEEADIIFHEVEFGRKSGVHTHITDLQALPQYIQDKIYCYHCQDVDAVHEAGFQHVSDYHMYNL